MGREWTVGTGPVAVAAGSFLCWRLMAHRSRLTTHDSRLLRPGGDRLHQHIDGGAAPLDNAGGEEDGGGVEGGAVGLGAAAEGGAGDAHGGAGCRTSTQPPVHRLRVTLVDRSAMLTAWAAGAGVRVARVGRAAQGWARRGPTSRRAVWYFRATRGTDGPGQTGTIVLRSFSDGRIIGGAGGMDPVGSVGVPGPGRVRAAIRFRVSRGPSRGARRSLF